jgi:hypothetical protein
MHRRGCGGTRAVEGVEVWRMLKPYLLPSEEAARHDLQWTLAASANHLFLFTFGDKFIPDELREPIRTLRREYAVETHG